MFVLSLQNNVYASKKGFILMVESKIFGNLLTIVFKISKKYVFENVTILAYNRILIFRKNKMKIELKNRVAC